MSNPKCSQTLLHILDKLVGSNLIILLDLYEIGDIFESV